ncbi:MAG: murein biosynthesis integral membrane protein MurJ [Zoogloeaceae bacterium]|jgi:putative peptidoglycan lipid II flippase|nr:murein biosynthesis integral membrane protein MurJ [Zoogloeaceae bacterium]
MNLLRALLTVSGMTLLSRVLGFVRDMVIARVFGAGWVTDAFFVAFKLPNLLRRLFAEGAFSQAFVPILGEYRNRQGEAATRDLIAHVLTALSAALFVVTALGILAAPWIIWVSAPGFAASGEKFALTVTLTRITFPYILFMSLTALASALLNTWNRFALPALTPALLNLVFIVMALVAAPWFDPPVLALAWAVFLGGVLQLSAQLIALRRLGILPAPARGIACAFRHEGVRRILKLMAPAVFGVSVAQISLLINTVFASFLANGSVSWLYYADRLMEFPVGLLGAALGVILLPSLSRCHATGQAEEYGALLDWGLRLTFLLALPAALALALLATPLVSAFFFSGEFSAWDVFSTKQALMAYSAGLMGMILVKVLAPGFYARQDVRTPVKIALLSLAFTQLMNLLFVVVLSFAHVGLALSIGLAACLNAGLLYRGLVRSGIYAPRTGWGVFFLKLFVAIALLALALFLGAGSEADWLRFSRLERFSRLAALVAGGAFVYFFVLWGLGFRVSDFRLHGIEEKRA